MPVPSITLMGPSPIIWIVVLCLRRVRSSSSFVQVEGHVVQTAEPCKRTGRETEETVGELEAGVEEEGRVKERVGVLNDIVDNAVHGPSDAGCVGEDKSDDERKSNDCG